MDFINKLVFNHILAEPGIVAAVAIAVARIDSIILFALRFFSAQTIKDELDRLDELAKKEVDKEANIQK